MGAAQAANVLTAIKMKQLEQAGNALTDAETAELRAPIFADYERTSSAWHATSELWDDGLIDPLDTRNALGIALSVALNAPIPDPKYGVFRM